MAKTSQFGRILVLIHVPLMAMSCQGLNLKTPDTKHTPSESETKAINAEIPAEDRANLIKIATVRDPSMVTPVHQVDLAKGPEDPFFTHPGKEFTCNFEEPDPLDPPGGRTPKFHCTYTENCVKKTFKIKYDPSKQVINGRRGSVNLEAYGEVLATRILWATGFGADRVYPVKVLCKGCPLDPWTYIRKKTGILDARDYVIGLIRPDLIGSGQWQDKKDQVFIVATAEIKYPAKEVTAPGGVVGWEWSEMYQYIANSEQKVDRDMLTILAAFIDHMDNKSSQQRLVCLSGSADASCSKTMLMIQDGGSSFGNGFAPFQGDIQLNKLDLKKWVKLPLWKDLSRCVVQIHGAPNASFRTTWQVTESARAKLANLMAQLPDEQILNLFKAARVDAVKGGSSPEAWLVGFKAKLKRDLLDARCQETLPAFLD